MKFDENKVYTSLNAEELKKGDKVLVADSVRVLRSKVFCFNPEDVVEIVSAWNYDYKEIPFEVDTKRSEPNSYQFAYLIERKENCTNCALKNSMQYCRIASSILYKCKDYKPKTEPHYRPFKNVDELIKVWIEKIEADTVCDECEYSLSKLEMPYIWVQEKSETKAPTLITRFNPNPYWNTVTVDGVRYNMNDLFEYYKFLDGSPCGIKE